MKLDPRIDEAELYFAGWGTHAIHITHKRKLLCCDFTLSEGRPPQMMTRKAINEHSTCNTCREQLGLKPVLHDTRFLEELYLKHQKALLQKSGLDERVIKRA